MWPDHHSKDGGGVDLQELSGVDGPVVLLRHVRPELMWLDHHSEVRGKRRASTPRYWGSRGMRGMPRRSGLCSAVVTIEVVAPLALALDDGAAVFS
jgi:hypothetical protein